MCDYLRVTKEYLPNYPRMNSCFVHMFVSWCVKFVEIEKRPSFMVKNPTINEGLVTG